MRDRDREKRPVPYLKTHISFIFYEGTETLVRLVKARHLDGLRTEELEMALLLLGDRRVRHVVEGIGEDRQTLLGVGVYLLLTWCYELDVSLQLQD